MSPCAKQDGAVYDAWLAIKDRSTPSMRHTGAGGRVSSCSQDEHTLLMDTTGTFEYGTPWEGNSGG